MKICGTLDCARPVPAQPSRGRARKFCAVCSPSRSRARAAAAAAHTAPPRVRTDVQHAVRTALAAIADDDPGTRLLAALAERLAEDVDAAEATRDRVTAARELLHIADRLDLIPPAPGRPTGTPPTPPAAGGDTSDEGAPGGPFVVPDRPPALGDDGQPPAITA